MLAPPELLGACSSPFLLQCLQYAVHNIWKLLYLNVFVCCFSQPRPPFVVLPSFCPCDIRARYRDHRRPVTTNISPFLKTPRFRNPVGISARRGKYLLRLPTIPRRDGLRRGPSGTVDRPSRRVLHLGTAKGCGGTVSMSEPRRLLSWNRGSPRGSSSARTCH